MSRNRPIEPVGSADVEAPAASPCPRSGRVCLACGCNLEPARAETAAPSARVGIFYYPWFGTPQRDGALRALAAGREHAAGCARVELLPDARGLLVVRRDRGRRADARDRRRGHRHRDRLVVGARVAGGPAAAAGHSGGAGERALGRRAPRAVRRPHRRGRRGRRRATFARSASRTSTSGRRRRPPGRGVGGAERAPRGYPHLREHEPRRACRGRQASTGSTPTTSSSSTACSSRGSAGRRDGSGSCAHRPSGPATTPGAPPATRG